MPSSLDRRALLRAGAWAAPVVAVAVATPLAAASRTPAKVLFSIVPGPTAETGSFGMSFANSGGTDYTGDFEVRIEPFKFPVVPEVPVLVNGVLYRPVRKIHPELKKFYSYYTFVGLTIRAGETLVLPFQWGPENSSQSIDSTATALDSTLSFSTGAMTVTSPAA